MKSVIKCLFCLLIRCEESGACKSIYRSRANKDSGVAKGSSTHITLHELLGTLACLETTLNYFSQATDPRYETTVGLELHRHSGFLIRDEEGRRVEFGTEVPAEGSDISEYFFRRVMIH